MPLMSLENKTQLASLIRFLLSTALLLASATLFQSAFAVYPEPGMYVDQSDTNRGRGFYVEIQNGILFLVIYAYDDETGEAQIFTANSEIRDDAIDTGLTATVHPPPNPQGYFPLHWMIGRLYKVTDGACLTCDLPVSSLATEEVGDVAVFFPFVGRMQVSIVLDDDAGSLEAFAVKQNYKLGTNNTPGFYEGTSSLLLPEIMGQWVFIDQSNPERPPWRFHFVERVPELENDRNTQIVELPFSATYRDSRSGAEFRCDIKQGAEGEKLNGCELHQDGQVLFSANHFDIGPSRIRAFLGELPVYLNDPPLPAPEFWRGPEAVIGVRIETPRDLHGEH
jgi:hypothetical protein